MGCVGWEVFVLAITASMRDDPGDFLHELDTLPLRLHCPACGDVNDHRVRRVAFGSADPILNPLRAEDLACVSCGRWSDLALTAEARLAVTGELLKLVADRARGPAARSRVLVRPQVPLNGRMRPVGEVAPRGGR